MIAFFDSATGNHPIFLGPFQVPFYHRRINFYKVYFGDNDTRSKFYTEAVVQNMLMFFKIGVLKNFGGKHPVLEFLFNEVAGLPYQYRNQSIDLQSKSIDWFLYNRQGLQLC